MRRLVHVVKKILGRGHQPSTIRSEAQLLAQVHQALFNESVLPVGLAAWSQALDNGVTFQFLMSELVNSRSKGALSIEDFIESAYWALLERPSDSSGSIAFAGALASKALSPRGFLVELVKSHEFKQKHNVGRVAPRGREAPASDPTAAAYGALAAGQTPAVSDPVAFSRKVLAHPTVGPALLANLYEAASGGRTAPEHLVQTLASRLRSGATPAETLGALLAGVSSEYQLDGGALVASGYLAILGRPAGSDDVEGYMRGLISGDLTPVSFLTSLMDSQEFRNRAPGHKVIGPLLLRPIYESIVGEPMSEEVLAAWQAELNRGASFELLLADLRGHSRSRAVPDSQVLALAFLGLQGKIQAAA